jgi:hypothetical protein
MPCGPFKVKRRFETTYRLHLQGRKINEARNESEADSEMFVTRPEDYRLVTGSGPYTGT